MGPSGGDGRAAVVAILLGNAVAVAGVFLGAWGLGTLFLLYWIETAVVGLLGALQALTAAGRPTLDEDVHLPGARWLDAAGSTTVAGLELFHRNLPFALYVCSYHGLLWLLSGVAMVLIVPLGNHVSGAPLLPRGRIVLLGVAAVVAGHLAAFAGDRLARAHAEQTPRDAVLAVRPNVLGLGVILAATVATLWIAAWLGPVVVLPALLAVKVLVDTWTAVVAHGAHESSVDERVESFGDLARVMVGDVRAALSSLSSDGAGATQSGAAGAAAPARTPAEDGGEDADGDAALLASSRPDVRAHVASLFVAGVARTILLGGFAGMIVGGVLAAIFGPGWGVLGGVLLLPAAFLNEAGSRLKLTAVSYRFYEDRLEVYNHASATVETVVTYADVAEIEVRRGIVGRFADAGYLWFTFEDENRVAVWAVPEPDAVRAELLELLE